MGANPSYFKKSGPDAPVERVSWNDSREFLKRLCLLEGVPLGTYRLPTEKEWEYACRAGSDSEFCYGARLDSAMANFDGNYPYNASAGISRDKTVPVGSFKANQWGLYDTHGNVWEWCLDSAGKNSREKSIRGGCWNIGADECRASSRAKYYPEFRFAILGLRIIREIPEINLQNKQTVK
jgi:formylglycine-generating enzyme required for sulfatase activity